MKRKLEDVTIKMFRHGLGDCFLLSFNYRKEEEKIHMLIDCGVLSSSKEAAEDMKQRAQQIKELTKGRIDILVATHEHWDHLSGFLQAKDVFEDIDIRELWMAWTEDPTDEFAQRLKEAHDKKFKIVRLAYDRLYTENILSASQQQAFQSFFSLFGVNNHEHIGEKESRTALAFQAIKNHNGIKKKYLLPGKVVIREQTIPGVRFYVLGPPKDKKLLKKMNPSQRNPETYLNMGLSHFGDNLYQALLPDDSHIQDAFTPFRKGIGVSQDRLVEYRRTFSEANKKYEVDIFEEYFNEKNKWRKIETDWLNVIGRLAIHLDNGINNTSLVIAIELVDSGKILFFPGDAQIGNWLSWKDYKWEVRDGSKSKSISIQHILARTVFYKVSHHGSHNATLDEDGLEKMIDESLIAMIPVDSDVAKKRGWIMPYPKLMKRLDEKAAKIFISDKDHEETNQNKDYHETIIANE
ncbi:hypothetical protein LX99_04834 [Mucilaginibacter oryzae]|uniref:Metallo-beta-lactamase domain-containing protein n=1 Tax=Mucilaginibacter oryzae TaxID=468058 RepID=A0A316GVP3_9SPHI|nr:MBL fold metallo-hydrolase [Mucilaginibacter oryzae]PWK68309.1 hypothetical protein LX99_04834 [Mucilaginibacter oryzae]